MIVRKSLLVIAISIAVIPGLFLAYSETQILSAYRLLEVRTSPEFAISVAVSMAVIVTLTLSALFIFRHRFKVVLLAAGNVIFRMSQLKFATVIVSFLLGGRVLVLLLDYSPVTDALWFHTAAQSLAETNEFSIGGKPSAYRFPGYPFLLSLTYRLFGTHLFLAWYCGLVASLLVAYLVYVIAKILYDRDVARVATVGISLHPALSLYSRIPMSDVVFTAGTLLVVYFALISRSSIWRAGLLGILLGGVVLIKANAAILVVVIILIWRLSSGSWTIAFRLSGAMLLGLLISIAPWSLRNLNVLNTPALSTNLGVNLLIGNHSQATGGYKHLPNELTARMESVDSEYLYDRYTRTEAIRYIASNPLKFLARIPNKIARLYATDNTAVTLYYQGQQQNTLYSKYTLYALCQIMHSVLLIVFILRIFELSCSSARPQGLQWVPWSAILLHTLVIIVLFGANRFRLPILPWMVIESSVYLVAIARQFDLAIKS